MPHSKLLASATALLHEAGIYDAPNLDSTFLVYIV